MPSIHLRHLSGLSFSLPPSTPGPSAIARDATTASSAVALGTPGPPGPHPGDSGPGGGPSGPGPSRSHAGAAPKPGRRNGEAPCLQPRVPGASRGLQGLPAPGTAEQPGQRRPLYASPATPAGRPLGAQPYLHQSRPPGRKALRRALT
jgi:hypothetical protein